MSGKDTVSARVPKDTSKRFERYRSERELSKSEAGKRLIESGLDRETDEREEKEEGRPTPELLQDAAVAMLGVTVLALAVSPTWVVSLTAVLAGLLGAGAFVTRWRAGQ